MPLTETTRPIPGADGPLEQDSTGDLFRACTTIQEALDVIMEHRDDPHGIRCPCCNQMVKRYRKKLNSGMAAELVQLVYLSGVERRWVHISKEAPVSVINSRQVSALKHWDLVERKRGYDVAKGKWHNIKGVWRPTRRGRQFVVNRWQIMPTHIYVFNDKREGFSNTTCTIEQALGEHFDLDELMCGGGFESKKEKS